MKQRAEPKKPRKSNNQRIPIATLLHDWEDILDPPHPPCQRLAEGKLLRKICSRATLGEYAPHPNRNPLALLKAQDTMRSHLVSPLRYERMAQSPFAFFRGAALIMASDLASSPRTGALVQLCGDCHLSNFGAFATPERNIIFDLNDFDETLPGPFEWDVKRLAASFVIAAEDNGFTKSVAIRCVRALAKMYRQKMEQYSKMNTLDVWYERIDFEHLSNYIKMPGRRKTVIDSLSKLKEKRTHAGAIAKLTEVVDGKRRIKDDPPLIFHIEEASNERVKQVFHMYLNSLWESRQRLIQRYHLLDIAAKVVGVGSVGTAAGIILMQGEGGDQDQIILQIKEASASVLEQYLGRSQFKHPGQRIVNGQRLLQAASDLFLGWTSGPRRDFYIRQLMDVKISIPVDELDAITLEQYAQVCANVLARAHARTGDPAIIHGYLGTSESFDESLVKFAVAYAKQNKHDHAVLVAAIKKGKIKAGVDEGIKPDRLGELH